MPALPVIADTFRVTLNWGTFRSVTPRNVMNILSSTGNEADIGSAIDQAIAALASPSHLFHALPDGFVCSNVDILPLDGTTASLNYVLDTNLTGGAGSGDMSPASSALVHFGTGVRGPRGRGRVYAGPIAESRMSDGVLDSTSRTLMAAAWFTFRTELNTATPPCELVVASYVHADQNEVTSSSVRNLVATQRRRQDQLR